MKERLEEVAQSICEKVDWTRPELNAISGLHAEGKSLEAVLALVEHLRRRETPRLGYTREYIELLRGSASAAQQDDARKRIEEALEKALVSGAHTNPVTGVGAETIFLGADEGICRRIGESVLAAREHWSTGPWGTTRGICELLQRLMVLPECPDEAMVSLFGWLHGQIWNEWGWARTWGEQMLGSSGHNWWSHTFLGLFEAGLFFPEFKGFARFRSFGPTYFEHELSMLMEPDGFTKERSGYHYGTAQQFVDFLHLAEANGIRLSPEYHDLLRKAMAAFWKVLTPRGDVPQFGDSGAKHREYPDMASQENLRRIASLLDLPEAKYVAEALDPDWKPQYAGILPGWGRDLMPYYRRLTSKTPPVDTVLPDSGYYFIRQNWTTNADYLALEAGPVGTVVSSHDHTAVFGFELYSRGRAILVDNGSGPYGDSPERIWRVGSSAHNVATVDGQDHIPLFDTEAEWRWKHPVLPFVNTWISDDRYAYFSGAHEGYRHLPEPVAGCRRKIFYLRGEYWVLIDRFTPETDAEHEYQLHFHVNAPCTLDDRGRLVTEGAGGNLAIVPVEGLCGQASLEPCPYPLDGYDNPEHLTYTSRTAGLETFVTLLMPFEEDRIPEIKVKALEIECDDRVLESHEATALEIEVGGQRDVYFDQHMEWNLPWKAGGCEGDGRLFHSRCR